MDSPDANLGKETQRQVIGRQTISEGWGWECVRQGMNVVLNGMLSLQIPLTMECGSAGDSRNHRRIPPQGHITQA